MPRGNGTAAPREVAEGGTAPEGEDGRSFGIAAVTDPWPRVRDDRPELLREPREHRVETSRGGPTGIRRRLSSLEGSFDPMQRDRADGRAVARPAGRTASAPTLGWRDRSGAAPHLPRGGRDRRDRRRTALGRGRRRSDLERSPSGRRPRQVGAHSRGAHPPTTPRRAREGARGVRASRGPSSADLRSHSAVATTARPGRSP